MPPIVLKMTYFLDMALSWRANGGDPKAAFYKAENLSRKIWFIIYRLEFSGTLFYRDPQKDRITYAFFERGQWHDKLRFGL